MTGFALLTKISNFAFVIELEKHIEILLLSNDCVIVPGLGGFTANHIPAKYDDSERLFIPPLRTLGFNPRLNSNDFLLVQSYSEAYDISYPEATARIENDVNEIRQQLDNAGSYELNDIGILHLNDNGNLEFTPCEAGLLTPYLYGLGSFEMESLALANSEEKGSSGSDNVVTVNVSTAPFTDKPAVASEHETGEVTDDTGSSDDKVIRIKYSVVRNVCISLLAIIILFALAMPVNRNETVNVCNIDNGIFHRIISNGYDKIKHKEELSITNPAPETVATTDTGVPEKNVDTVKQQTKTEEDYFCLVLASKVSRKNAEAFASQLVNEGYDQARVLTENNSTKVIYGHYNSLNLAYNCLNRLKKNQKFCDAWVYQVKN